MKACVLYGSDGSPYSCKMRSVLRYRRIPFQWLGTWALPGGNINQLFDQSFPKLRGRVIPVLMFPDGSYANDSTHLILELEKRWPDPQRSLIPRSSGDAFLADLIEDFADEWVTKARSDYAHLIIYLYLFKIMFEGRFATPEDAQFGAEWQLWQGPPEIMRTSCEPIEI